MHPTGNRTCVTFVALLLLCAFGSHAQTAADPLLTPILNPILDHPDPFITPHPVNGRYLLLASAMENITIWSGRSVPTAASQATVVFRPTDSMREIWSPTLWKLAGRWWIYFTAREAGKEHAIYALESDTADPLGTYSFEGALPLGRPAIDPSLLTVAGVNYLMYVTVDGGANEIHAVRLAAPMQPSGEAALIARPEYPWEQGAGSTKTYPVNEGPTALYHAGKTFIVYSASDTASPAYCLGLLQFKGGDPLRAGAWVKSPQPVFTASPAHGIYGPGRGTFAQGADGADWLLYAARTSATPTEAGRATRAQRFTWAANGMPEFGQPLPDGPITTAK